MEIVRKNTKKVSVGNLFVGGGTKISVQSMTTFKTSDTESVIRQIHELESAGCDIVRVSVTDGDDAAAIRIIRDNVSVPIVADIHFSSELALSSIENGCHKVRINPGNIGSERDIRKVADCVKSHRIAVRVGANTGSIKKEYLGKYGQSAKSLVMSVMDDVRVLENCGVEDIVVSAKASSVNVTVEAYRDLSKMCPYPLHLGVTEAGVEKMAVVKSATAFAPLLLDGIGDTVRVSVTGDPVKEVHAAQSILRALDIDKNFVDVISCPTCGRCVWDCVSLSEKVSEKVKNIRKPLKVAVMGCVVNGPGEARECDIGIAGGDGYCLIFKGGEPYRKVDASYAEEEFMKEIESLVG